MHNWLIVNHNPLLKNPCNPIPSATIAIPSLILKNIPSAKSFYPRQRRLYIRPNFRFFDFRKTTYYMKNFKTSLIRSFLLVGIALLALQAHAQETYKIQPTSTFSIVGSSNIRDWEAKASPTKGTMTFSDAFLKKDIPKSGTTIDATSFQIPVAAIDGGRGDIMNGKIRTALQAETHPNVSYELTSATVTGVSDKAQGTFDLESTGKLTIGGVTREITMNLKGQRKADGSYLFFGSKPMKMSQFEIEAPSALFGQLQTEDDIAIRFSLEVKK